MTIDRFEDIIAWRKARLLVCDVYQVFSKLRDYGFRDQITRASVSIVNNIAEGFERRGDREFKKFLFIAKGSCGEVRSMLYLSKDLKYLSEDLFIKLNNSTTEISKVLSGLIKSLKD